MRANDFEGITEASRNQEIFLDELAEFGVSLFMKREDELHPHVSGNKYRKLKYNLQEAAEKGHRTLLSFGGAYSNHIAALAYAGRLQNLKTIGIIRGDELKGREDLIKSNATLSFALRQGMQLEFVSREFYRKKSDPGFEEALRERFGEFYLVPEGGTNELAVRGCEEILTDLDRDFDYVCVSVGTGGTISGLINSAREGQFILGFPSLKGDFLETEIAAQTIQSENWSLIKEYHFGGYAKVNEKLISFINRFYRSTAIPLDPIYTGKMMFGIVDMITNKRFNKNSRILAIHTGGLQGIEGMNRKLAEKKMSLLCSGLV
jgi:1-aminocyclopropane-1-carboxylate deaminase